MGWTRAVWVSSLVVATTFGAAHAQPGEPEAPPDPPPAAPPPAAPVAVTAPIAPAATPVAETSSYPRELVLRPLLLPQGGLEGSLLFTLQNVRSGNGGDSTRNLALASPRLRYGFGVAEAEVSASLVAFETEDTSMFPIESERFQTLFGAARFKVSSQVVVGAELAIQTPTGDFKTYSPRAMAATKLPLSQASAAELAVRTGVDRVSAFDSMGLSVGGTNTFVLSSEVRLQAQLAPEVAVEARALLAYYNPSDDGSQLGVPSSYFAQTYGLRLVGAATRDLDLSAGFDVLTSTGDVTVKLFSVGVAARRVP